MGGMRKIAAILVADVVGYSRLAGVDEDRTLSRLRGLRSDLIDPAIDAHHGRIVKRTGDGSSPSSAAWSTLCAAQSKCRTAWSSATSACRKDRRIEFRIGVHLGDVVEEADGDLMGDGVNIAARLEAIAAPGAICLSEDAYRQVKGRLDLVVTDLGDQQLKNIADPIGVYSLDVDQPARAATPFAPSAPKRRFHLAALGLGITALIIVMTGAAWFLAQPNHHLDKSRPTSAVERSAPAAGTFRWSFCRSPISAATRNRSISSMA